jgi:hypothetical protein
MNNYTVGDVSYGQDGELEQFLLFWEQGEPDTRRATPENVLLFDPEDALPFEGGMHDFFNGESALRISKQPEVVVSQSGDEYSYIVSIDGSVVETTPNQAETFLEGVYDALAEDDTDPIEKLHRSILSSQVRRFVVNALKHTFGESHRIEIVANGWLVDEFYLVDWNANLYSKENDPDEGDYIRENGQAVQKDTSYELVRLRKSMQPDPDTITINGDEITLTEREMLFLAKVRWLLDRRHYHPDEDFWTFTDQWANIPAEDPNLDLFSL